MRYSSSSVPSSSLSLSSFSLPLRTRKRTLAEEDHRPAGAAQRLVRRRRDDVGVLERRRDEAGGDEPGDVRHVGQEP